MRLTGLDVSTSGEKLLARTDALMGYLDLLPEEEAQLILLSVQAVMGPAKAAVGLAGNFLISQLFGEEIEAYKNSAALSIADSLTREDREKLSSSDEALKALNAEGQVDQSADVYVRGAAGLLDIALGSIGGIAGAASSKAISVAGAKGAGGAVELIFDKATRTWTTPAGLDYGPGSVHGNRVKHVLDHAVPNPNKTTHSVFNVERNEILGLIDKAWLAKGNPMPNDPGAYIVPLGRVIGTAGETNIKIIVRSGTNKIITAYPIK